MTPQYHQSGSNRKRPVAVAILFGVVFAALAIASCSGSSAPRLVVSCSDDAMDVGDSSEVEAFITFVSSSPFSSFDVHNRDYHWAVTNESGGPSGAVVFGEQAVSWTTLEDGDVMESSVQITAASPGNAIIVLRQTASGLAPIEFKGNGRCGITIGGPDTSLEADQVRIDYADFGINRTLRIWDVEEFPMVQPEPTLNVVLNISLSCSDYESSTYPFYDNCVNAPDPSSWRSATIIQDLGSFTRESFIPFPAVDYVFHVASDGTATLRNDITGDELDKVAWIIIRFQ